MELLSSALLPTELLGLGSTASEDGGGGSGDEGDSMAGKVDIGGCGAFRLRDALLMETLEQDGTCFKFEVVSRAVMEDLFRATPFSG